jgi:hypothetical protein
VAEHAGEGECGCVEAYLADLVGEDGQFNLERGVIVLFGQRFLEDAVLAVFSDGKHDHLACSFEYLGAGDEEGVDGLFVLPGGDCFADAEGFSGHGGLVCDDVVAFDEVAID